MCSVIACVVAAWDYTYILTISTYPSLSTYLNETCVDYLAVISYVCGPQMVFRLLV